MAKSSNKRYQRASNYRKKFFDNCKAPYRCVYCGRRLKTDEVEVDHLISVAKAQKRFYARLLLKFKGINNVNDTLNLVPACKRCNRRKSSKMGLWIIKGTLGQYTIYWIFRKIITLLLVILCIHIIHEITDFHYLFNAIDIIIEIIEPIIKAIRLIL